MIVPYDKFVDAKGKMCPQPLLLTKKALQTMAKDQVLLIVATDEHTELDLQVWCERFGHAIICRKQKEADYYFWIKKSC